MLTKPNHTEYSTYHKPYIEPVAEDVLSYLDIQQEYWQNFSLESLMSKSDYAYAPEKWTIKETLAHVNDVERIFAYRALCLARNDKNSFPGFDQNDYIEQNSFAHLSLMDLLNEFVALRSSNLNMFRNFSEKDWDKTGTVSNGTLMVKSIPFIIAGHLDHHIQIIKERYLD